VPSLGEMGGEVVRLVVVVLVVVVVVREYGT
jgi:hypothetical protein